MHLAKKTTLGPIFSLSASLTEGINDQKLINEKSGEDSKDWKTWNWYVEEDRSRWGCDIEW